MLRFIKPSRIFVLLILLSSLLLGTACSSEVPAEKTISSPIHIPYLVKNPLDIITDEKGEGDNYTRTISIKGLSNEKIQESINNSLKGTYEKMQKGELPPYRGIRQKIRDTSLISSNNLDANLSFNYNNVASFLISGNRSYQDVYVGMVETYNIDLNTGEEITLQDVFADDVDYKKTINDYIVAMLLKSNAMEEDYDMNGGGLKLVSTFKGISDDQKFYLFQGGIGLIMDYNNPEFDTNFYPVTIYINFEELGDVLAIAKRFYNQEIDLYESETPPVYEFLQSWGGENVREEKNEMKDSISMYQSLMYDKGIPQQAKDKVISLYSIDADLLKEMGEKINPASDAGNSIEQYSWASKVGKYTNVTRNINMYFNNEWRTIQETYCYDAGGKQIGLADLFIPGYDYKPIIIRGLNKTLDQMPAGKTYKADQLYEELQFTIGLSEISFATAPIKSEDSFEAPVYFSISFEEIGCSNLIIFSK